MERLTIEYDGQYVPKKLCTINDLGEADDCEPCDNSCKETYIRLRTNGVDRFPPSFEPDEIENEPTPEVYRRYQVFCAENSLQPMGNVVFTKQICKRLKLRVMDTRIDGKKTRIYVKDE